MPAEPALSSKVQLADTSPIDEINELPNLDSEKSGPVIEVYAKAGLRKDGSDCDENASGQSRRCGALRTTSSKDKEIFTNRYVWLVAAFLFLYVGAEVSM